MPTNDVILQEKLCISATADYPITKTPLQKSCPTLTAAHGDLSGRNVLSGISDKHQDTHFNPEDSIALTLRNDNRRTWAHGVTLIMTCQDMGQQS